jgi:hypothetical protein
LIVLVAGSLFFWAIAAGLAYLLWEDHRSVVLGFSATALALCLLPAMGTLLWAQWSLQRSPEQQLTAILGGTGLRMFLVLAAGFGLSRQVAYFQPGGFLIWLLVFYLFILALEMILLVGSRDSAGPGQQATK